MERILESRALGALFAALLLLAAGGACAAPGFNGAQATRAHYGAIFHIDEGSEGTIRKTLTNIENLLVDPRLAGRVTIELIANGKGFAAYVKGNGFEEKLRALQKEGVILALCSNTLRELKIDRGDLYPFVAIVPSGMGEITLRKAQGWAYIHPSPPSASDF